VNDLHNKKPTKILLSECSLARAQQAFSIFAARLQGMNGPNFAHVLLTYGSVVKPSFDKLLVSHGTDINLVYLTMEFSYRIFKPPRQRIASQPKSKVH
jgi:U3 small nucleolar RNA-associated protein 5